MPTFNDGEIGSSVRGKINSAITHADSYADDVTAFFASTDTFADDTIVVTRSEGFAYKATSSTSDVVNAAPQDFEVLPTQGGIYPAKAFKTGTDTAAVQAAIDAANAAGTGIVVVSADMSPTWSSITEEKNVTIFDEFGAIRISGVGLYPYSGTFQGHVVFEASATDSTRVYAVPRETTPFQTDETNGIISSFTAFMDNYREHLELSLTDPNVTGPHYRDGGISAYVGSSFAPTYSPAGMVAMNAKVSGNWFPFRPAAALSVSQKPIVTAFELQPYAALPGPTFAGGGVYPTDRWRPGKVYSSGDIVHEYGRVYEVITGGTSGQTPPLHDAEGTPNDGDTAADADAWDAGIAVTVGTWNSSSSVSITGITQADPGVVTTGSAHGLSVGDPVSLFSVGGMTEVNNRRYYVATVPTTTTLTLARRRSLIEMDTSGFSAYTSGGTLETGFFEGTDGGGTVEYALIEQLFGTNQDNTVFIGDGLNENPLLELGDYTLQIDAETYLIGGSKLVAANADADGAGETNNAGLHPDFSGGMVLGYERNKGLLAKANDTDSMTFNNVCITFDEKIKGDGDTTVDVSNVNIVKFEDTGATNFTGFTGAYQGQVIYLLFNNSNTTLVHSTGSLRIPGGANVTPDSNEGYTVVMRSATIAQVMN